MLSEVGAHATTQSKTSRCSR